MTAQQWLRHFKGQLNSFSTSHYEMQSGTLQSVILLREMAILRRRGTEDERSQLEPLRRSAVAWYFYFRWRQERPRKFEYYQATF